MWIFGLTQTIQELKKLNQSRVIRKKTLNDYWQQSDPKIVKIGYATIRSICVLGRIVAEGKDWIKDFTASLTWARSIRDDIILQRKGANQHTRNFDLVCSWVDDKVEDDGFVELADVKSKYVTVTGSASKSWDKLNKRNKTRLELQSKCIRESFVGKTRKTCIRQNWRFVRKTR